MKKKLIWFSGILILIIGLGYFGLTKFFFPRYMTSVILSEDTTSMFIPKRYEKRFIKTKKRINSDIDSALVISHSNGISLDQLLKAVDEVKEEQVYDFLDELNSVTIVSTDQVFDIGKKHFHPDFDLELFRQLFKKKVTVPQIKGGLLRANKHREEQFMSPETVRTIFKQLLIEKEKKYSAELDKINKQTTR